MCCSFCSYKTKFLKYFLYHQTTEHSYSKNFKISCVYPNCLKMYASVRGLRKHINEKHKNRNVFPDRIINLETSSNPDTSTDTNLSQNASSNTVEEFDQNNQSLSSDHSDIDDSDAPDISITSEMIMKNILKYKLMHVSQSAINSIVGDFHSILQLSIDSCRQNLFNEFQNTGQSNSHITTPAVEDALKPLTSFKNALDDCSTLHKQNLILKHFDIVLPQEIHLEGKDSFMYVPIEKTISSLVQHEDILGFIMNPPPSSENIKSYFDSEAFRENILFSEQHPTLQIKLYMDDFQIVTPLGNKTIKNKITAVYYVIGNIPHKYSSKLHTIQLAILCKSCHVKTYGFNKIMDPLISSLSKLEEGLVLPGLNSKIYGTISTVISDNLAAHELGGLVESFNSLRSCRFCKISKTDMHACIDADLCQLRTKENFNQMVNSVTLNSCLITTYGIKCNSVLNKLKYFHVCWGCPSDVSHDIFEGVAPDLLKLVIDNCLSQRYFTLDELNSIINRFPYYGKDKKNKISKIKSENNSQFKVVIKQTAAECKNLVFMLPLFIASKIPENDEIWKVYLNFLNCLDFILAPSLKRGEIIYMSRLISTFLENFLSVFGDRVHLKPKFHYMLHYAKQYLHFGPLIHSSTLRFEGKHVIFKSIMSNTKNFKNTTKTMAEAHQQQQCYYNTFPNYLSFEQEITLKLDQLSINSMDEGLIDIINNKFDPDNFNILTCKTLTYEGVTYLKSHVLVIGYANDLEFGQICAIVKHCSIWYFVVNVLDIVEYSVHFHNYVVNETSNYSVISLNNLVTPFPSPVYSCDNKKMVSLRFYIQPPNI